MEINLLVGDIQKLIHQKKITMAISEIIDNGWETVLDIINLLPFNDLLQIAQKLEENGLYDDDDENNQMIKTIISGIKFLKEKEKIDNSQFNQLKILLEPWWS